MNVESEMDLKRDLDSMATLLKEIQGGTKQLLERYPERVLSSKRVTPEQRRAKASSAWAKSTVDRAKSAFPRHIASTTADLDLNVDKSEKAVTTRAPAYTIAKRYREKENALDSAAGKESDAGFYDVNIEACSNHKRVKAVKLGPGPSVTPLRSASASPERHGPETEEMATDRSGDDSGGFEERGESPCRGRGLNRKPPKPLITEPSPRVYSFPKSARPGSASPCRKPADAESFSDPGLRLDVDHAEKWLQPHIPGAIMRPDSAKHPPDDDDNNADADTVDDTADDKQPVPSVDFLSYKFRTPGIFIKGESKKKPLNAMQMMRERYTPGPGEYEINHHYTSKPKGGQVYRTKDKPTRQFLMGRINTPKRDTPGVGAYDLSVYDKYMKQEPPTVKIVPPEVSESKITPQLEKKHYWEDKARDLREDHDNMKETNDSLVRARTRSVVMRAPTPAGVNWKNRQIMQQRMAEKQVEAGGLIYDVNRSLIEKRAPAPVDMAFDDAVKDSINKYIRSKPGVARVIAEKEFLEKARDKFYGPQLPVDWAGPPLKKGDQNAYEDNDNDHGEPESPTKEIMRILGDRNKNNKRGIAELVSETAEAFLRSSHSAAPVVNKTAFMRPESTRVSLVQTALEEAEKNRDFLGPQLPVDWVAEADSRAQRHKGLALQMSVGTGRDEILVPKKGQVIVKKFAEDNPLLEDEESHIGPGVYDHAAGMRFGEDRVKGLPFAKGVARRDQVGPYGERPESAVPDLADEIEDELVRNARLDFDFGEAKDKNEKHRMPSFELYKRDRLPPEKPAEYPAKEKLGGEWFEGMAEAMHKQRPTVLIDKMSGRTDGDKEKDKELLGEEFAAHIDNEGALDIDIMGDKPNARRTRNVLFSDAVKYPRFGDDGDIDADIHIDGHRPDADGPKLVLSPSKSPTKKKTEFLVDMSKQQGREGHISGAKKQTSALDAELERDLHGEDDLRGAIDLAMEREEALLRGEAVTGKHKKPVFGVDMGRQRGRADTGEVNAQGVHKPAARYDDNGNTIDDHHILELDLDQYDTEAMGKPKKGGVKDWAKETTKRDASENEKLNADPLLQEEKLIISPKREASSKHKKTISAPAWDTKSDKPRGGLPEETDAAIQAEENGKLWVYPEVDRKTGKEVDWKKPNPREGAKDWNKQMGRDDDPDAMKGAFAKATEGDAEVADPLLREEKLIVEPNPDATSSFKRVKGAVGIGKKTGRADEAAAKKIVEEMTGPPDEVQIDPDDKFKQKKVQRVSNMRQPVARKVIRHEDGTVERVGAGDDGNGTRQANKKAETRSKAQSEALSPLKIALSTPKSEGGPRPPTLSPDALERKMKQLGL